MALTVSGKVRNFFGTNSISSATVNLYRKDTGAFVATTTSDGLGDFSITTTDFDPYSLFLIAFKTGINAGVLDVRKSYISVPYQIYNDVIDVNTDLIIVDPPTTTVRLAKVVVESSTLSSSTGTLSVMNTANGAGTGITVSITSGAYKWSNTGDITTTSKFYIRSVNPAQGVSDVTVTLIFEYPELITIPLGAV